MSGLLALMFRLTTTHSTVVFSSSRRLASYSSLGQDDEDINLSVSLQYPLVPRHPLLLLRCFGPYYCFDSERLSIVARGTMCGPECLPSDNI